MCTSILMTATDHSHLLARTMDWYDESSRPLFIPRKYAWQSLYNEKWHAGPYAILGVGEPHAQHEDVADGVNEKGLAVHKLTFQNAANFSEERKDNMDQIAPFEFVLWALTHCASVDDLIAKLPTIELMTSTNSAISFRERPAELHFIATDPSGRLILIEPTQMPMSVIDNPLNVTTNAVDFRREVTRLKQYFPLHADNWEALPFNQNRLTDGNFAGLKTAPTGFTPTARFIRTMINKERLDSFDNERAGVIGIWHVLNNVTVPAQHTRSDTYTVYRSAVCIESRRLYFESYSDFGIREISFPKDYATRTAVEIYA
ncbi:choloylglycine hydrolase [Weissella uvarum]|uniref:linear amide C-N hydrolase n=1 Tax=Weissella uvarum TaxID=1479233 RepID=UPI001961CF95|nr:linear amide C-N hydrolase [Weissella uvarum]MBM7617414.1 choloylglycine hydrolase [Weissella uvarum]MCM0595701.1 linear amide C-N hydrolase [Weissella uvarum]